MISTTPFKIDNSTAIAISNKAVVILSTPLEIIDPIEYLLMISLFYNIRFSRFISIV